MKIKKQETYNNSSAYYFHDHKLQKKKTWSLNSQQIIIHTTVFLAGKIQNHLYAITLTGFGIRYT